LEPSRHKRIQKNTKISVEVNSIDGGDVTICAFIEATSNASRAGKWNEELPSEGFKASEDNFKFVGKFNAPMKSYCRVIKATN